MCTEIAMAATTRTQLVMKVAASVGPKSHVAGANTQKGTGPGWKGSAAVDQALKDEGMPRSGVFELNTSSARIMMNASSPTSFQPFAHASAQVVEITMR